MSLHKIVELIFTLVMLLFLSTLVLGILVGITLVQQMSFFEVGMRGQVFFVGGMFAIFLYIMKMIVDKIKDYHRYV
ncbi:hypothetical protein HOB10_00405 [Candidatus Parcubacteria bacterium]|jgi:hypothetical protein|nr:hypothetical protein [Candidatus Parcubacteria bacterium]